MNITWINGKPYVEDERSPYGLRELTLYELEQEGMID